MLSASIGPGGGSNVLAAAVNSAPFFGNDVKASLAIPAFFENFDAASTTLTNTDLGAQLRETLAVLAL